MGEKGRLLFSNSAEKPFGAQPKKESWKGPKKDKKVNIKREQIKSIEADRVDIDRHGGKQPLGGEPEIDHIDIKRHKLQG